MSLLVTEEDFADIRYGVHNDWVFIKEGDWVQNCKNQVRINYVKHKPTGKFYEYSESRSSDCFSYWCYKEVVPEFKEVVRKEREIVETYWSYV